MIEQMKVEKRKKKIHKLEKMSINKFNSFNGITLVALVITVIIIIILATVTINFTFGENGLITQAQRAKELTEEASEKESLSYSMVEYMINKENVAKLGISLYDKTADNSAIWDVFVDNRNNIAYGTGWNYISAGTNINGNVTESEWLLNYDTGEIIEIDENYTRLTHGDSIGVTDNLIFNLDPSIIDTTDVEDLKSGNYETLWKDTTLNGFNWTEESGLTAKEFNFDGIDDYITVKYDSEEQKNTLAQNGFTFEYYGTIDKGNSYDENNEIVNDSFTGIFGYWNGNESDQADFRFGISKMYSIPESENIYLKWNAGFGNHESDFSLEPNYKWNIWYPIDYTYGKEIYYTITLDTTSTYEKDGEEYYKQTVYSNGEILCEGGYNKKSWDDFINNYLPSLNYFCIGRCSMSQDGWWHYSKMNAYTLRLYSRALTENEVKENHQKSVAYHESLQ